MTTHIEIDSALYERIAKVAEARGYPTTAVEEIEQAIVVRLDAWEPFLFRDPAAARKANFPSPP